MAVGHACPEPLASFGSAMATSHVRGKPGLVDEDETVRIEIRLTIEPVPPPLQDVRPILLARMGGLLWDGPPLLGCIRLGCAR